MDWSNSEWYATLPTHFKERYKRREEETREEYQYDREKGIALLWEELEYLYEVLRKAGIPVKTWQERGAESNKQEFEFEENPWKN